MLISLIYFFSAVLINFVISASNNCHRTPATTELHRFNNHVLKRRIRSLVFPNKAQLLLTPAFTKAVLDGRPRGLAYSVEFDMYSPLPDTIEGWQPTILVNKPKDKIITSDSLKKSLPHMKKVVENQKQIFANYTEEANRPYVLHDFYNFPFHANEDTNLEWTGNKMNFSNRNFKKDSNIFGGFASNFHKLPYLRKRYKRNRNFSSILNKKFGKRESFVVKEFGHGLQSERERKEIHKQIEIIGKILKFNAKNCIQRAICELNSEFSKHGEFVMEDIIRLILVPPYRPNVSSERDIFNISCKERFVVSCPYSILNILTKNVNAYI